MVDGALAGLTVVDLSFYAPGRVPSMVLADMGADVICVEMPRGSRPSEYPNVESDTQPRWLWYQRNKRSVTLNLKAPGGREVFERLVRRADVVIESFKPGTARRLGVDYESVCAVRPDVVYCSVTGFGQTGPYAQYIGHEPNYQALSGVFGLNRVTGGEPHPLSVILGDVGAGGSNALAAILAALFYRSRTGKGQYIDVAITAGMLPYLGTYAYGNWLGDFRRHNPASGDRMPYRSFRTGDDRHVAISPMEPWLWQRFCAALEVEDLLPYREPSDEDRPMVYERLEKVFAARTQAEWVSLNDAQNLSITAIWTSIDEVEQDPQMRHLEMFQEVEYEPLGTVKQIGIPYRMSETPAEIRWIPRYGQHTDEVLRDLGYEDEAIARLRADGTC